MSKLNSLISPTLFRGLALLCAVLITAPMAGAQNLFAPVARVNDLVVTEFEVQQRQRFLQLLNAPGSDRDSVVESLIEDRLKAEYLFNERRRSSRSNGTVELREKTFNRATNRPLHPCFCFFCPFFRGL